MEARWRKGAPRGVFSANKASQRSGGKGDQEEIASATKDNWNLGASRRDCVARAGGPF